MNVSSCYCYFAIKGDFPPDDVSTTLEINPSKHWAIGDKRKNGGYYDFALWETGFTKIEYPEIEMRCAEAIRGLRGKEGLLKQIKEKYNVSFFLEIVPSIYDGKEPVIEFGKEVIEFCYLTETDIDIDMYVYPFEEN